MNFIENFTKTVQEINNFQPRMYHGASNNELSVIEKELQVSLPEDFKNFYKVYNGQDEYADCLFDTFSICTLKKILEYWKALRDNEEDFSKIEAEPERGVKNTWGSSKWVPFASTADGHYLCMDFDPTQEGTVGQIITFWYNSPEREWIAPSFKVFIEDYIKKINNGTYIYGREDYGDVVLGAIVRGDEKPMFGLE